MVEMGWTPREFWSATVPEFWCAVDWMAEKNADVEIESDERRSERNPPRGQRVGDGIAPTVDPTLWVPVLPGYREWREDLRAKGI